MPGLASFFSKNTQQNSKPTDLDANTKVLLAHIPALSCLILGSTYLPKFGLGVALGLVNTLLQYIIIEKLEKSIQTEIDPKYIKMFLEQPINASLIAPIAEELTFRGGVFKASKLLISALLPATARTTILGTTTLAEITALIDTSIIFGLVHYPLSKSVVKVFSTGLTGMLFGALALEFGLTTSIAAHMSMNTALSLIAHFSEATRKAMPKKNMSLVEALQQYEIATATYKK